MTVCRRTARQFLADCRKNPENAKFFSDAVLVDIVRGPPAANTSPRARELALAELAVRQMLAAHRYDKWKQRLDVATRLREWIGPSVFEDFRVACEECGIGTDTSYAAERAFDQLNREDCRLNDAGRQVLREVFMPWLTADGIIPVFNAEGAYLLPFSFSPCAPGRQPCVQDAKGELLEPWTSCVQQVLESESRFLGEASDVPALPGLVDVCVDFCQTGEVKAAGNSLMLPVLMAVWRCRGLLPRYNVLRFIATGAYEGARLGAVDTEAKLAKVSLDVDCGMLLRPGGGIAPGEIPVGLGRPELLERVRACAEEYWTCEPSYAISRLDAFDALVRDQNFGSWKSLCERLDHTYRRLDEEMDPEGYLRGLMLRSAACCHAGLTEEARHLNLQAAQAAARNQAWLPQLLRLQIEELVLLQDEEDFARVFSLAPDLKGRLEAYARSQDMSDLSVDLLMRYEGTMGQFYAYAFLAGTAGMTAEASRGCFERAYGHALELHNRSRRANGGHARRSAYANLAQDANYILLWAALFRPAEMDKAYERSAARVENLRSDGQDVRGADKSRSFGLRTLALGLYRAVLAGSAVTISQEAEILKFAELGSGWVSATTCKYMGAVLAARGEADRAAALFDRADRKMQELRNQHDGNILRVIHMTVLTETYRSMRRFPAQASLAETMREKALAMFACEESTAWRKDAWRAWLTASGVDATFPGHSYWY